MDLPNLQRNAIVDNKWLKLLEDKYSLPNGTQVTYYHAQQNDAVMSIALTNINRVISTYVVNQYRHPIGREIWQFPLGGIETTNQDAEQAARAELLEECGVVVGDIEYMGSFYANPGFTNQSIHVFISNDVIRTTTPKLEDTEFGLVSKTIPVADLSELISNGEMGDAWGITGLHYINAFLKQFQNA